MRVESAPKPEPRNSTISLPRKLGEKALNEQLGHATIKPKRIGGAENIKVLITERNRHLVNQKGEIVYMHSAHVAGTLQGQKEVEKALEVEGKEPPDRRFCFVTVHGAFYDNMKLESVKELYRSEGTHKHLAVFENLAIKVDDIYCLSYALPEESVDTEELVI